MSDHKELLERLRYLEKNDPYVMTMSFGPDITEAADAIEALRAENERLQRERDDALAREVEWLMRYKSTMIVEQRGYDRAIDEAAARVDALRIATEAEAVATSAGYADAYNGGLHDAKRVILALKDKP